MDLTKIPNQMGEALFKGVAPSGLPFLLNHKPEFSKTMGVLGVRFGSTDQLFQVGDRTVEVPEGTAHFLEHKLFENQDGDVSDKFAVNGASCNAGTGFTTTSYLFSCTDRFQDNLKLLLDFVQSPFFTAELINKEQGIIGQEIKMYNDDPGWIVFFNLMESLYREHPVRQNIAGTVESIGRIDTEVLHNCYKAFYRPGNMVLTLVGKMDLEEAAEIIRQDGLNREKDPEGLNRRYFEESDCSPARSSIAQEMLVSRPKILMGFKDSKVDREGKLLQRREFVTQMVIDILFGKSSPHFAELYQEDVIDDSFCAYFSGYMDFAFTSVGGDTEKPEHFRDRITALLEKCRSEGLRAEDFHRQKNKYLGKYIRTFNSIESTAFSLMNFHYKDLDPAEVMTLIESITLDDLNLRLKEHFDPSQMAYSIIWPSGQVQASEEAAS